MKNYVCWDRERLNTVLDPDALQIPDNIFLATHVRRSVVRVDPKNPRNVLGEWQPETLLRQCLDPEVPHLQAIVLGTSGAGKSRLIRWLSVHIPETDQRRVVLVQKSGTNLRGVIEQILGTTPGTEFDVYRQRLRQAVAVSDPRSAPEELLNQIQQTTGPLSAFASEALASEEQQEVREILIETLPSLLGDPVFRRELKRRTTVIDELVRRVVGKEKSEQERERGEKRREFHESDLNVKAWDIDQRNVNSDARSIFLKLWNKESYRIAAAEWINRNLNDALGRLLSFSKEDLGAMLLEVRRSLYQQNKELVLLIEDFARLQGIDYALLDAISERPGNKAGAPLCRLRSIMAMTTGYYQRIEQTFSGRIDVAVNVDPAEEAGGANPVEDPDLLRIAGFHLNALRLMRQNPSALEEWSDSAIAASKAPGESLPILPSACRECPNIGPCHAAFGKIKSTDDEAFGLYPFTRAALREMYRRTRTEGVFNPRVLLGRVLRQPLLNYSDRIESGQWPPQALVLDFGRAEMPSPIFRLLELKTKNPDVTPQYSALFELYGHSDRLDGVKASIIKAFGLTPFDENVTEPISTDSIDEEDEERLDEPSDLGGKKTVEVLPAALQRNIDNLNGWAGGGLLPQALTNEVRNLLYSHVKQRIDWNPIFLGETAHSATRGFAANSFTFEAQLYRADAAGITLTILRKNSIAIEAALRFQYYRNWSFDINGIYQPEFIDLLDELSRQVVDKLRAQNTNVPVDPAPALTEALAIIALLCGAVIPRDENSLLATILSGDVPQRSLDPILGKRALRLLDETYPHFGRFRALLMAQISCAKGPTTVNANMIDAARIIPALRQILSRWEPTASMPETQITDYRFLFDVVRKISRDLPFILQEEKAALQNDLEEIGRLMGGEISAQKTREALLNVSTLAEQQAVWRSDQSRSVDDLKNALGKVRVTRLDPLRQKAERDTLGEPHNIPTLFAPERRQDARDGVQFVQVADDFLERTLVQTESRLDGIVGGAADAATLQEIADSLSQIENSLLGLQPSPFGSEPERSVQQATTEKVGA